MSTKFYVLDRDVNNIIRNNDFPFDLYYTDNNSCNIKGATLIVPTVRFKIRDEDCYLTLDLNKEGYEKSYGVDPGSLVSESINFPIRESDVKNYAPMTEYFKPPYFKWARGVNSPLLMIIILTSLDNFIIKEFNTALTVNERDIDYRAFLHNDLHMVEILVTLDISRDQLKRLVSSRPEKFVSFLSTPKERRRQTYNKEVISFMR